MIKIINDLDSKFGLLFLFKQGIIPWTVLRDRDIYLQYDIYLKLGVCKKKAAIETSEKFKVDIRTVYRAIAKMNEKDSDIS